MATYAWIESGKIRDICPGDPQSSYAPEVARHYSVVVPNDAANGDSWDGKVLTKPAIEEPVTVEATPEPEGYTLEFTAEEGALFALFRSQLQLARKG